MLDGDFGSCIALLDSGHHLASPPDVHEIGSTPGSEGALGLRGGWGPIDDHEVDALIETIYAARRRDTGRPVELEDSG